MHWRVFGQGARSGVAIAFIIGRLPMIPENWQLFPGFSPISEHNEKAIRIALKSHQRDGGASKYSALLKRNDFDESPAHLFDTPEMELAVLVVVLCIVER